MRSSSLTPREGLVLKEANFKSGSLREKKPTFPDAPTSFPPPPHFTPLQHDIPGTSPEIPDQTSALVLVENLPHPSFFFCDISTIRVARFCTRSIFVFNDCWFGDHTDSSRVPHLGLHQKQVERPSHIDVRYERAGPLQRSKELVGLGDASIMCVSSLRSKRLKVFGRKKEEAPERETRAPRSFLRPLVPSAYYAG